MSVVGPSHAWTGPIYGRNAPVRWETVGLQIEREFYTE